MKLKLSEEQAISLSKFNEERNKRNIVEEFQKMAKVTWTKTHKDRLNQNPQFDALNRYVDILPCKPACRKLMLIVEDTRVILKTK